MRPAVCLDKKPVSRPNMGSRFMQEVYLSSIPFQVKFQFLADR
ncbi:hypothetical protein LEP1GSC203_2947 [Leptospira terpstrae serovar Hualin str. LT 11-33 = ATCC 700639]|uniref:Uncharacterized protein n=1 Tax=Leptospira terpstrae serovar Hualin str. LT 11-33 = ATCC 700639 TaxID=1257025 RepID=N1W159_9LEPT|nr:hypothetical protein LEP1GSC203_2947 [Leptospira terpstrae serovar Hualin str. LT 11-33 = ATCC 700639]